MIRRLEKLGRLGLIAASVLLLDACNLLLAGGSSSTETGDKIQLTGRVVGENHEPISGIVALLAGEGLSDTTDADGRYHLERPADGPSYPLSDSVIFSRQDQRITAIAVSVRVGGLPEVQVIRRKFSGHFAAGWTSPSKMEAVVTGEIVPDSDPIRAEFEYDAFTSSYRGLIFFAAETTVRPYAVTVYVYGDGGMKIGQSETVGFSSRADSINLPPFSTIVAPSKVPAPPVDTSTEGRY